MKDHESEEDLDPKPNEEKEVKSSAKKDTGMLGEVAKVDPLLGYIAWFTNMAELYQKNCNCFRLAAQITWWKTPQRTEKKTTR